MYKLIFAEEFEKNFDKLKDKENQRRILKKVLELKENPDLGKMLAGITDEVFGRVYRLRVGKYRILQNSFRILYVRTNFALQQSL
ncbi:MAG: type II toxin-antitoxin system RelE/ParE family toxin [Thermoplasmata archaeon]